jgi:hypothetical protein
MIRIFVLAFFALSVVVSCVSHVYQGPYQPASTPEKIEFCYDRLDVYPDDIRKDLNAHTNVPVAWTGIILSTDAYEENTGDKIVADTVFEHHYFDWVQDGHGRGVKLSVSLRGEGLFRTSWHMNKTEIESSAANAEKFAAKGKLAIIYGMPESIDANGTVVLKYRYLRILDQAHFTTNDLDYGRMGDPIRVLHLSCKTN